METRQAKRSRIGPTILDHATVNEYNSFLDMEVQHELNMSASKRKSELAMQRVKVELSMVRILKEAYEEARLCETREGVGLPDIITGIQCRAFPRTDG